MGWLLDKVAEIATRAMKSKAERILSDLQRECPKDTGATAASFHIMDEAYPSAVGIAHANVFIGSDLETARYAEYGNGGPGAILTPKHARWDGSNRPPALGKYPGGIPGIGWRAYVHGYYHPDRQGFVERVARKHR